MSTNVYTLGGDTYLKAHEQAERQREYDKSNR